MHRTVRKPLIVFTPKSLLRSPSARSATGEFTGGHFRELLDDPDVEDPASVTRLLFCSGKVGYSLMEKRDEDGAPVAVVRLEQLYPFPHDAIDAVFEKYPNASEVVWVQEEPANMAAWTFVQARLNEQLPDGRTLHPVTRPESGSPATGSSSIHAQEHQNLLDRAFGSL